MYMLSVEGRYVAFGDSAFMEAIYRMMRLTRVMSVAGWSFNRLVMQSVTDPNSYTRCQVKWRNIMLVMKRTMPNSWLCLHFAIHHPYNAYLPLVFL
jgi:hypothetical protein